MWGIFHGGALADTTLLGKLRYIDSLYRHAEDLGADLDDAISTVDFDVLCKILDSFFISLLNAPAPNESSVKRWKTAFHFVRKTCERVEKNPATGIKMEEIRLRLQRLDNLFLGLRPYKKRLGSKVRALPRSVLLELLEAATPGSETNPFEYIDTQWRIWAGVCLLFFQGIRIGEMASLPANFVKSEVDIRSGNRRFFMSIKTDESEDEPRYTKPGIKTVDSIRTIPMSGQTAGIMQTYEENFRGKPNFIHFLISMQEKPLSVEGMRYALRKLTSALSPDAKKLLFDRTGAKNVTAQPLRHTCAVIRLKQWSEQGIPLEQVMERMRSFFGWSKDSLMPLLYAKAALDEQLSESWNDQMDMRVNILRNMPDAD